jgi:hypothetical protein
MYYIKKYVDCWAIHNDQTGASRVLNEAEKLLALQEFTQLVDAQVRTIFADKIHSIKEKP